MLHLLSKMEYEAEPGFNSKDVRWALCFDSDGRFLEVIELGDTNLKNNRGRKFQKCPDLSLSEMRKIGSGCRHFLVDSAAVVTLLSKNAADEKLQVKHRFFVSLLRKASECDSDLALVAAALDNSSIIDQIAGRLRAMKAKPTDKVTPQLGDRFLVASETWHQWWRSFRKGLLGDPRTKKRRTERGDLMRSFASGERIRPARVLPKIRGLASVGGLPTGEVLSSYKQEAFCSYGLKQSANAAVSEQEASSARAALENLLESQAQTLCNAKVVHWFARRVSREDDPFLLLDEGLGFLDDLETEQEQQIHAQNRARELLNAVRTGKRPDLHDNSYYALTLSGSSGRVMVRDWMEGQFEELIESVDAWFEALEIVHFSGVRTATVPGIERIITCLLPIRKPHQKYKDWVKPIGTERMALWHTALMRALCIPVSVLSRLVDLNSKFNQTAQLEEALEDKAKFPATTSVLHARMSIMKAFHIRKGDQYMKAYLNEEHPSSAYHCGRLMAVLAAVQRSSLPGVGAGIVQRYYAAASATPALVLGRLVRTSQFHLSDISKSKPGLAHWYETRIASIFARIVDPLPTWLSLEDQSLFALGYYQQLACDRSGKTENDNSSKENRHE